MFAGNVFVVGEQVSLSGLSGVVDEDVGIGSHTCYGADHVAAIKSASIIRNIIGGILVQDISFSAEVSCSRSLLVTFLSAAKTIPSFANIPNAVPAWEIASRAYST